MKILSFNIGANATAAIMEDGIIKGAINQEKFDFHKNSDAPPSEAVRDICDFVGWNLSDIDHILIAGKNEGTNDPTDEAASLLQISELVGKPTSYVDHHLCHARAAYHGLCPDFLEHEPALIFTMDDGGDGLSSTVSLVDEKGHWRRLAANSAKHSLGKIYADTTRFLGMKSPDHEYKVMALAAYAKAKDYNDIYRRLFLKSIKISDKNNLKFTSTIKAGSFYKYLKSNAVGLRFDYLSGALQRLVEELTVKWIQNAINITGVKTIFIGGDLFMNVKVNKKIQEIPEIDRAYFMPSCDTASLPLGALYEFAERSGAKPKPLADLYLGRSFSDAEIDAIIGKRGRTSTYDVERVDDIELKVAELLADRHVVARFSGRCEWGARSLGNRALLAHPSHMESYYEVNDRIKARDFWMPFAPSILDSHAKIYLKGYDPNRNAARFMITAYDSTPEGLKHLRAALHQGDHTLRPQVITPDANPDFYRLIKHFADLTGVGGVLNTSMNIHGYPLAATPEQALFTFENSGLEFLALGSFLFRKNKNN